MNLITNLDLKILLDIQQVFKTPFLDKSMPIITSLGNAGIFWIVISLILICTKKHRYIGILCLCSLIITSFLGEVIIKNIVQRNRPFIFLDNVKLLITPPNSYSFPSGHTAASFTSAAMLSHFFKKYRIIFFALAITIAFSRLYLLVHYPSDVLVGMLLGLFGYFATIKLFKLIIEKNYLKFNKN
ncbi:phosphatase PAP2 family protein [Clostridium cavendishii]|uniref:phosphatase PAP2 family protein n=1 Tax=Clostridium cavendishii TaxID=349931 RepID=UPI000933A22B